MDRAERRRHHEQNRRSWNAVTEAHNSHKLDQAAFLRDGGSTLFPDELELLGQLEGKRVLHLQCNCGQDSLSLASLGAQVTGVDISDQAIEFARRLSADSGLEARFVRSDLLEWFEYEAPEGGFDVAFASYGTIGWLGDLQAWARGVARVLAPGGRLVLLEFHPIIWSLSASGALGDPYFVEAPIHESGVNDYVGGTGPALAPSGWSEGIKEFENPERSVSFQWTVAQIVQSLIHAGLLIADLREYPYANGCRVLDGMVKVDNERYVLPENLPSMPLMLGVVAHRN